MGDTKISWTDATWNPVTGCTKISAGCAYCYIERTPPMRMAGRKFVDGKIPVQLHPDRLEIPLHWRKPRRVFVCSMGDLFHEDVPDEFLRRTLNTMALAEQHTFQVLTKRPERIRRFFEDAITQKLVATLGEIWETSDKEWRWPLPNVHLGVTAENQQAADERIPILLDTPAAKRFVSCEPLLGPLDLTRIDLGIKRTQGYGDRRIEWNVLNGSESQFRPADKPNAVAGTWASNRCPRLDLVIIGGESGGPPERALVQPCECRGIGIRQETHDPNLSEGPARPAYYRRPNCMLCGGSGWRPKPEALEWMRRIRDDCQTAGVSFHLKGWGGPGPRPAATCWTAGSGGRGHEDHLLCLDYPGAASWAQDGDAAGLERGIRRPLPRWRPCGGL